MSWRDIKGAYDRRRRALRQAMLEPLLVGWPELRDTVMRSLAARGQLVFCQLGDVRFFVDPSDRVVGAWLMWHGAYQRREIDQAVAVLAAAGRLPADAVFVDVGANIGTHTVYALKSARFARAVAFEPEPRNAKLLAMNIEANGFSGKVTVVPKAVGEAAATAVLHLHPRNKGAHAIGAPPADDASEQIEVPVVRLADALGAVSVVTEQIGLIWIDVEGHEPQVLRGLGDLLTRRVPIAFEYAPQRYRDEARRELVRLLAAHYSTLHSLNAPPEHRLPIHALTAMQDMDDILVF
jgi:FkbM family methyltransferase